MSNYQMLLKNKLSPINRFVMLKIYLNYIAIILSIFCQQGFSQIPFEAQIIFPQSLIKDKLSIRIDNGRDFKDIKFELHENQLILSDTFYGTYSAIEIFYPNEDDKNQPFYAGFFVSKEKSTIQFYQKVNEKNPIKNYQIKNAIDMKNEDYIQLKNFVAEEEKESMDYINNLGNIQVTDSIMAIAQVKANKYVNKQTEFFKNCSGSYYCLWYFKQYIAVNNTIPSDSLLGIYQNAFPENMKNSFEGYEIVKIINGRSEKKYITAPNFIATDINGNKIFLEMFRGSYVLIDFWASWCGPCVKELPYIKEIRKKYSEEDLKIIFITQDNDFTSFSNAVIKHKIDFGIHIFSTPDLINLYGAQAIPKTFLIDPKGVIIYNNQIEKDSDLHILNQLLKDKIKK